MYISIKPGSPDPIFQQIHDSIIEAIVSGDLVDGQRLDPVRRVAADLGINPATVKKAYDLLQDEGIIVTARRSGSVIAVGAEPKPEQRRQVQDELHRTLARASVLGIGATELRAFVADQLDQLTSTPTAERQTS
nr:GntR family transcriptional regulator [Corynebacterium lactis]